MQVPRWLVRVQTWQNLAAAQNAPGHDEMTTVWTIVSLRASVSGVLTLRFSWWAHDSGIHSAYRHSFGRCFGFFGSPCTCKTTKVIIAHSGIHTWQHNDRKAGSKNSQGNQVQQNHKANLDLGKSVHKIHDTNSSYECNSGRSEPRCMCGTENKRNQASGAINSTATTELSQDYPEIN